MVLMPRNKAGLINDEVTGDLTLANPILVNMVDMKRNPSRTSPDLTLECVLIGWCICTLLVHIHAPTLNDSGPRRLHCGAQNYLLQIANCRLTSNRPICRTNRIYMLLHVFVLELFQLENSLGASKPLAERLFDDCKRS